MISNHRRIFKANCMLFASVAIWGAWSCAAPDAQPSPEPPDVPDANQSDAVDAPDASVEPIAGDPVWSAGFGEATNDQKLFDIAFDPSSNSLVSTLGFIVGITIPGINNEMPFTSGLDPAVPVTVQNILVAKHDATTHKATWAVPIRAGAEMVRSTVDVDKDGNVIVAGGFIGQLAIGVLPGLGKGSYDAYIVKIDSEGKPLWVHTFGVDKEDYITDVATDGDGNIIVVGLASSSNIDFGDGILVPSPTSKDIFVAKYDPDGKLIWVKRAGQAGATDMNNAFNWREPTATVAVSRVDGSIIVGGTYRGVLNFPPVEIMPVGGEDGFVVKLDAQGKGLWSLTFGSTNGKQRVRSVALGSAGEVFFTGAIHGNVVIDNKSLMSYKGTQDLIVAKVDTAGKPQWLRTYGQLGSQVGTKIIVDEKGGLFVGGSFTGSIDFFDNGSLVNGIQEVPFTPTDVFVSKFQGDGSPLWAHAFGDLNPPMQVGIQTLEGGALWKNENGEAFVTFGGINSGVIDFHGKQTPLPSLGLEDAYLMSITY